MIITPHYYHYRLQEVIRFLSNVLASTDEHGTQKLKLKEIYQVLSDQVSALKENYMLDVNNLTPQLEALDLERDQAIICLRKIVEGYTHHPQPELSEAGIKILECIDKYGSNIYRLNYSAETTVLEGLVRDLRQSQPLADAVKKMHMEEVVAVIEKANLEFDQLHVQRLKEYSRVEISKNQELVKSAVDSCKRLFQLTEAHAILQPSELYDSFINHLNETISHFNDLVERRKKVGHGKDAVLVEDNDEESSIDTL